MSLLSIVANKNIIVDKIKELESKKFDSVSNLASYVITECLKAQYSMMRNVLNKNMIAKRHFDSTVKGNELLDTLYQHIYSHNFVALTDEIFEVEDAIDTYKASDKNTEKSKNAKLLVVEELIDTFHFILEYTALLEEHYQLILCENKEAITVDSLTYYMCNENPFSQRVNEMLDQEGTHIFSYLINSKYIDLNITDSNISLASPYKMMKVNREFIRKTNFKDWKVYPSDYYGVYKFSELFELNRQLYASFFQMIQDKKWMEAIKELLVDTNYDININSTVDTFKVVYGIYMAKNAENIRRQKEDPRYTGQTSGGNIVGVEV